jgi:hypothetical protein
LYGIYHHPARARKKSVELPAKRRKRAWPLELTFLRPNTFLRKEEITSDQQRSRNKAKIHRRTLDPGVEDEDEAAVDAPLPKLPKLWIAGAHHEADGKSPTPPLKRPLPPPLSLPRRSEATTSRMSLLRSV